MATTSDAGTRAPTPRAHRGELWRGLDHSFVMGLELMAATLLYAGLGWLLDRWLSTGPWFFAVGALLGNAAGIYLIWVRSSRMDVPERTSLERSTDVQETSRAG